jgi:hypothetical protein
MTPQRAQNAVNDLNAVLWFQNERLYQRLRARMPWRRTLRGVALILCVVGILLAVPGVIFAPHLRLQFVVTTLLFALFFLTFQRGEALEQAIRRGTRRLVAGRARRAMASVIRKAPYTIHYAINDGRLTIRTADVGIAAELPIELVRYVVVAPSLVCVFDQPFRQRPLRVLYVPGPAETRVLQDTFANNHIDVVTLA